MARGKPRLSLRLPLSPTTATTDWDTMDLATGPTATAMDFTTARGRLRLSPRPLLIPTCCTVATGPTAMATGPTAGLGYHGLGYRTYGYGHGLYYGKREAEAEPKAAADPYLLYGGYRTY